jgi:hypothetical protein
VDGSTTAELEWEACRAISSMHWTCYIVVSVQVTCVVAIYCPKLDTIMCDGHDMRQGCYSLFVTATFFFYHTEF